MDQWEPGGSTAYQAEPGFCFPTLTVEELHGQPVLPFQQGQADNASVTSSADWGGVTRRSSRGSSAGAYPFLSFESDPAIDPAISAATSARDSSGLMSTLDSRSCQGSSSPSSASSSSGDSLHLLSAATGGPREDRIEPQQGVSSSNHDGVEGGRLQPQAPPIRLRSLGFGKSRSPAKDPPLSRLARSSSAVDSRDWGRQ